MLSQLFAFDSLNCKPCEVYDVEKAPSQMRFSASGEHFSRAGFLSPRIVGKEDRLFMWQSELDKLFIREISFKKDIFNGLIEVRFSNARVIHCELFYEEPHIYVLVSTSDGICQITHKVYDSLGKNESIFSNKNSLKTKFYPVKNIESQEIVYSAITRYNSTNSLFAYVLKKGVIVFVSLEKNNTEIHEVSVKSHNHTLLSGILPAFSSDLSVFESPASAAFMNEKGGGPLLVSVCRDHCLRIWDLKMNQCCWSFDLFKCLQMFHACFDGFGDIKQRMQAFAPGVHHRIKVRENFAVIYMELHPTKKISLPHNLMTFWVWIRMNVVGGKPAFEVFSLRNAKETTRLDESASVPTVGSLIDFAPYLVDSRPSNSGGSMDVSSNEPISPSLGMWTLVDLPNDEGCGRPKLELIQVSADGMSFQSSTSLPGDRCVEPWQEPLPRSVFSCDDGLDDLINDDVTKFLSFIFTPGRFAKVAIFNAFKSLRQTHQLSKVEVSLDDTIPILATEIHQTLGEELKPTMKKFEFETLLRAFHQSVVDYHQRALEPLGLFCIPPNGDPIVIHRSGLSVVRQHQETEELLIRNPIVDHNETGPLDQAIVDRDSVQLDVDRRLMARCRQIAEKLAESQVWLDHERSICDKVDNFSRTEAVLDQLLTELRASDACQLLENQDGYSTKQTEGSFMWIFDVLASQNTTIDLADGDNCVDEDMEEESSCLLSEFASSISAELLRQGMHQATIRRLRFCVAVYLLWRQSPASNETSHLGSQLAQLYRSLALTHWLTVTRAAPLAGEAFLASVWAQLKILGMEEGLLSGEPGGREVLLQCAGLSLLEELLLSSPGLFDGVALRTSGKWRDKCRQAITALQTFFCPIVNEGSAVGRLLKHLLFGARCKEILTLCRCLAPNAFTNVDLADIFRVHSLESEAKPNTEAQPSLALPWWQGDVNVLYVSAFLSLLWSESVESAVEQHIAGSVYLRNRLLSRFNASVVGCLREDNDDAGDGRALPCSLLHSLFPAEFSLTGSLGFPDPPSQLEGHPAAPFCVDEVQVRYLIKAIPVLEQCDMPREAIRLCEYSLGVIKQAAERALQEGLVNCFAPNRQPTSLLCGDESDVTGVGGGTSLFPPLSAVCTDDELFRRVAQNLAELEAVLRTRIFRHELVLGNASRAIALVVSNPDKARQRDCLHLLITTLCDQGRTTELVDFEYGELDSELVSILESRARAADVLPKTQHRRQTLGVARTLADCRGNIFYDVLYAYYVRRQRFHAAAEVVFEQAVRLLEELILLTPARTLGGTGSAAMVLHVLQEMKTYLSVCINTLSQLPTKDQWIIRPDVRFCFWEKDEPSANDVSWAFEAHSDGNDGVETEEQEGVDEGSGIHRKSRRRILRLEDLEHIYLVVRARLRLATIAQQHGMVQVVCSSLNELYDALIAAALYEDVYELMQAFKLDAAALVTAVASRCAVLSEHKQTSNGAEGPCLPALINSTSPLQVEHRLVAHCIDSLSERSPIMMLEVTGRKSLLDFYWSLLRVILAKLSTPEKPWDYYLLTCEILLKGSLTQSSVIQLPGWLILALQVPEKGARSPVIPLLRLLIEYNRLQEASRLAASMLVTAIGPDTRQCPGLGHTADLHQLKASPRGGPQCSSIYLPHGLLFNLLDRLADAGQKSEAHLSMHACLEALMTKYYCTMATLNKENRQLSSNR